MSPVSLVSCFRPFDYLDFRRRTTVITDKRIRLMGEIIAAIKLIKVYCWEKPFADVIRKIRKDEINLMKYVLFVPSYARYRAAK